MSLYSQAAEMLQFISPEFYKVRFFKKLRGLNASNIFSRKVEPEMLWLKNYLPQNAVFFDIGANVGAYIFLLENQLKPKNIFAFEPNKALNIRLKRLFPEINLSEVALSDENTIAEFKVPVLNGKAVHSRGTLQKDLKETGETDSKIQKVQVQKLDEWIKNQRISRIDFIKIDVEGNELQTLRGAKETIQKFKPVLMVEIEQRHHNFPVWNIIEEVCNLGFEPHYLDRKTLTTKILTQKLLDQQNAENMKNYTEYINNIIFIPRT